eukprot:Rhum_TRINITY_DN14488_c13_g1::Rhum_TRINITY_DN14488_c13_g1_i3::g.92669::m.92669
MGSTGHVIAGFAFMIVILMTVCVLADGSSLFFANASALPSIFAIRPQPGVGLHSDFAGHAWRNSAHAFEQCSKMTDLGQAALAFALIGVICCFIGSVACLVGAGSPAGLFGLVACGCAGFGAICYLISWAIVAAMWNQEYCGSKLKDTPYHLGYGLAFLVLCFVILLVTIAALILTGALSNEPEPAPKDALPTEPAAVPEPEPVRREPEPEPEPVKEEPPAVAPREVTPEPVKEAAPLPPPVAKDPRDDPEVRRKAGLVVMRALKRNVYRRRFVGDLAAFKAAEAERLNTIRNGKAGSIGCAVDPANMKVREKAFKADGAAGSGGMKPGDLIAGVTSKGRGGKPVFNATPKTVWFLASVGPPNGVFEGSSVTVHVIRNEAAQQDFLARSSAIKISSRTDKDVPQYKAVLDSVESIACNVTMQAESDGAKRTRVKKLTARKKELNIEKMDIDLVNNFMSDPDKAREQTKAVFLQADKDASGKLEKDEIAGVFTIMSESTGCPNPSKLELDVLFYNMDEDCSGEVEFDEFYPHFRSHQIREINELLFESNESDDE